VGALKSSKLARGGSDALGVLPWYLIIGPPGAGKSTALSKSGLQFPYLSAGGRGVKGVAGTRNCEWWLTNEAVILDTAGRYTTEDNDRDEWLSFLDMLAKNRPRRPLNGLLVAVSVGDFVELDEEGSAALGQRIRERIDEVMSRLKVVLPVYLLFTKCDLLAGFVETFGELAKNERGQIWGFTLPAAEGKAPGERFAELFDELSTQVSAWSLDRLAKARRLEDRERIFQFPAQFDGLRGTSPSSSRPSSPPTCTRTRRCSAGVLHQRHPGGRPIDRVMRAMASAFGLQGAVPEGETAVQDPKSYFLRDVFGKIIFKDQSLAVRSASASRRDLLVQRAYTTGGLALAALLILLPTVSFFRNLSLVHSTRDMVAGLKGKLGSSTATLKALTPLRTRLEELLTTRNEGAPLTMRFGMWQGDAVLAQLRPFYGTTVRDLVVKQVLDLSDTDLAEFVKTPPAKLVARTHLPYWEALKLSLVSTAPREESEPALDDATQEWMLGRITRPYFARALPESSEEGQALRAHVATYLRLLAQDPELALPRDGRLVERSRAVLRNLPLADLALERVIAAAGQQQEDLTLTGLLGGSLPQYTSKTRVRAAFTKRAYTGKVGELLKAGMKDADGWVLAAPGAPGSSAADLESAFFKSYIAEWRSFLESIELVPMRADRARVQALLDDLTGGTTPPLSVLFERVAENTRLEGRVEQIGLDLKDRLISKLQSTPAAQVPVPGGKRNDPDRLLTATDVRQFFEPFTSFGVSRGEKQPAPIDRYYEQLIVLRDGFRAETQDASGLALRIRSARASLEGLLASQNAGLLRPVLYKLTSPPLDEAYRVVTGAQKSEAIRNFCNGVGEPFRALAKRYPFAPVPNEAPLADVADFFRPKTGQLWVFFEAKMKGNVLRAGDRFLEPSGERVYPQGVISYLGRANEVTRALFPPSSNDPQVPFSVHIHPVPKLASVAFTVDGDTFEYRNGPEEWRAFRWPSPGKTPGASIRVRDPRGKVEVIQQDGDWGLLRLFEQATVASSTPAMFTLSWRVPTLDSEVLIDVKPVRGETPFSPGRARGSQASWPSSAALDCPSPRMRVNARDRRPHSGAVREDSGPGRLPPRQRGGPGGRRVLPLARRGAGGAVPDRRHPPRASGVLRASRGAGAHRRGGRDAPQPRCRRPGVPLCRLPPGGHRCPVPELPRGTAGLLPLPRGGGEARPGCGQARGERGVGARAAAPGAGHRRVGPGRRARQPAPRPARARAPGLTRR
jgi:type VI secretion system protein ImpL